MARELDAKIATILSDTSIAINVGEDDGVDLDSVVFVWRSVDVEDPDNGEVLGTVKLKNLKLNVYEVYPRLALAKVEAQGYNPLAGMFKPGKVISSTDRILDQDYVDLSIGDAVTVIVNDDVINTL